MTVIGSLQKEGESTADRMGSLLEKVGRLEKEKQARETLRGLLIQELGFVQVV